MRFIIALCLALVSVSMALATPSRARAQVLAQVPRDGLAAILIHPVVRQHFVCLEHPVGQLRHVGDALGADCLVIDVASGRSGRWPAFYKGSGQQNTDWYGWDQPVLAPFNGVVDSLHVNPTTNAPGLLGGARASVIVFRRADGARVLYAHVQSIAVAVGDSVRAGQPVARVGNNGPAVMPHTHIGAWRGNEPLQIRFDLRALGRLSRQPEGAEGPPDPPRAP